MNNEKIKAEEKEWYIEKLTNRHMEFARLLLKGESVGSAARILGFSESQASRINCSPIFKSYMAELQSTTTERVVEKTSKLDPVDAMFKNESMNSALTLVALRNQNKNLRVQKEAATEILNRAGYTGKKEDTRPVININLTDGKMALIAESIGELSKK
jgi:hypothetical protein